MRWMWHTAVWVILVVSLVLGLSGCGGGTSRTNVISGTVTDVEGEPVVDAEVFVDGFPMRNTRTLHNGTYYLTNVPVGFRLIRARAFINGVEYTGQQVAQVLEEDQSKNINLMVARTTQQGTVEGFVRDAFGRGIEGARVFAGGALSSVLARTDRRGFYRISGLPSGYEYPIVASAPGYENDERRVEVYAGETSVVSFTLNTSRNAPVNPPQNLRAIAWTLPRTLIATRDARTRRAYESIQQLLDPQHRQRAITRSTSNSLIEVSLTWDYERQLSLLGYGIYRGRSLNELQTNAIAFLRDPLADFFSDL
ncbi:MAG: carboxypeptidase regulatory-like domain-containing protein, partial [Fimbriimonadales bacterium]